MFNWSREQDFFFAFLLILFILGFSYYYLGRPSNETLFEVYQSSRYGIHFKYPEKYALSEKKMEMEEPVHYSVTLFNKDVSIPKDGEFPPAITIDIYENDGASPNAFDFIKRVPNSNWKLSNGQISTTTYGSLSGVEYFWSGLYEGRTFAVYRPGFIYLFSVTSIFADDPIQKDFNAIINKTTLAE